MKPKYLKIVFVIDESGSMQGSNSDVVGGFNSFIEKQKAENTGKITVSLYKFNNLVTRVINNKPAAKVRNLTMEDYRPSGFTALYDAIGQAIHETDKNLTAIPENERPDKVLMVIITDGQENASKEFSSQSVSTLISAHEKLLHWGFIYLGAKLENFTDADALGLKNRVNYQNPKWNKVFDKVSEASVMFCTINTQESNTTPDLETEIMTDLENEQ